MKYTADEKRIFSEYVVADRKGELDEALDLVLVPTYVTEAPKKIHIKRADAHKFTKDYFWPGGLVTLNKDGTIEPVEYDMRKCDIMLVTGAYNIDQNSRQLTLMGKKFGFKTLDLYAEPIFIWHQKFYSTQRGDSVLVRPIKQRIKDTTLKIVDNEYEILRNFTTENLMYNFWRSQWQH